MTATLTTADKIATCQFLDCDYENRIKVFVCANDETLCLGETTESSHWDEMARDGIDAAVKTLRDLCGERIEIVMAGFFGDWNGGRHVQFASPVRGKGWGYRALRISCHEQFVAPAVADAIDAADDAMQAAIAKTADELSAQDAAWRAQCEAEEAASNA